MKRYTLKDNKTGIVFKYSYFIWKLAWAITYAIGVITGYCIEI